MNFQFFLLLVYMSLSSFALAFIAYYFVVRALGKEGTASRMAQIILIPLVVIAFDMYVFYVEESWTYFVASIPLAGALGFTLYAYFFKGGDAEGFLKTPQEEAKKLVIEPKKVSKKSQRIHEARKRRGRE